MPQWIVTLFGESLAPIVWVVIVAAIVCLLAVVLIILARKAFGRSMATGFKSRVPRLAVMDVARIDEKRRLVLVRRDEVEHLLLIGGQADLLIEPGILRVPAASGGRVEPRAETPSAAPPPVPSTVLDAAMRARDPRPATREAVREPDRDALRVDPRAQMPIVSPAPAVLASASRDEPEMRLKAPSVERRVAPPPAAAGAVDRREVARDGASFEAGRRDSTAPAAAAAMTAAAVSALRTSPPAEPSPAAPSPATPSPAPAANRELAADLVLAPAPTPEVAAAQNGSAGTRNAPVWPTAPTDRDVQPRDAVPSIRPAAGGSTRAAPAEPRAAPVVERQAPIVRTGRSEPSLAGAAPARREDTEAATPAENPRPPSPLAMQSPEMELSRANLRAAINSSPSPRMASVMEATAPAVVLDGPEKGDTPPSAAGDVPSEQERARPPLSVKSFATAIQNRKAPPVMPAPAIAAVEPAAAAIAVTSQPSPGIGAQAPARGAGDMVTPTPASARSSGRIAEQVADKSDDIAHKSAEPAKREPSATERSARASDASLEDFLSAELDMNFDADDADTGDLEDTGQTAVPRVEPDGPVRRPDLPAAGETGRPVSRASSDWSAQSAGPRSAGGSQEEERPRVQGDRTADPVGTARADSQIDAGVGREAGPSAGPQANRTPAMRAAQAQRQAERARAIEVRSAAAARAAIEERPARRAQTPPTAPSVDPQHDGSASAANAGASGEAPRVVAERASPRETSAPPVASPTQRPASGPVDRQTSRPDPSLDLPDASTQSPRKLTLEEEMEQLLGSFDFNEPDRRSQG